MVPSQQLGSSESKKEGDELSGGQAYKVADILILSPYSSAVATSL